MLRRNLIFLIDRLQITRAERITISFLLALLFITGSARLFWQPSSPYNKEYYQSIEDEFNRLSAAQQQDEANLLARYYPPIPESTKEEEETFFTLQETSGHEQNGTAADSTDTPVADNNKININKAGLEELTGLPGIGPVLAGRIIAYREEHGVFALIEDLRNVRGIGAVRLEQIRPLLEL